jgi:integrase
MNDVRFYIEHVEPVSSPLFTIAQVTIRTHLNNIADKAGLKRIRLHDLRHSHASYLIHLGVPITTISRRLGHKNSSITLQVYSHMYKNADADLAKMLEDKIKRL